MIKFYQSSTDTNNSYLSSYSRCSNCTSKELKNNGKRKLETNQNRVITDYESGEMVCSLCGMVISDNHRWDGDLSFVLHRSRIIYR